MSSSASQFRGTTPTKLKFGTSGLRGLVTDITDLEAYINTKGFLKFALDSNDVKKNDIIYIAGDLRPSSHSEEKSIMCAVQAAIENSGLKVHNLGLVPTPALTFHALQRNCASVMITGSHIPFDRNGIKFNKSTGEVLKSDEADILKAVAQVRDEEYSRAEEESLFDDSGSFKKGKRPMLPEADDSCAKEYTQRYIDFFGTSALSGLKVAFFQHSAVGRDLLTELLKTLGAEVVVVGRSTTFVPIDTEAISDDRLADLQAMADSIDGKIDAIVSTDGDSDRPLVVGIDKEGKVQFFGGDLLGVVVADLLGADALAVPISTNDCVDLQLAKRNIRAVKTRIGSPYVVKAMQDLAAATPSALLVGWEANGGFLTGSPIARNAATLAPLPTRDAALPIIAALNAAATEKISLIDIFAKLPPRFSKADLIDNFARSSSLALLDLFAPPALTEDVREVTFGDAPTWRAKSDAATAEARQIKDESVLKHIVALQTSIGQSFSKDDGFGQPTAVNWTDGVRMFFDNGDIAHIRPSGNAPQLRIYAVAATQTRANDIARKAVAEPNGILRQLEAKTKA